MGRRRTIQSSLVQFLLFLIAVPLVYVVAFVLLAVVAITLPYRLLVYILAKTKTFGSNSNIIGFVGGETGALATDPLHTQPTLNIVQFYILDDIIPVHRFREIFQERIIHKKESLTGDLVYGKYQQYWVNFMGYNMWRWDTGFNIDNHIKPSMGSYTTKDLPQLMSDLIAQPFKRGQSPWEITLIHNYKEEGVDGGGGDGTGGGAGSGRGKMVVVNKVHHALADGFSLFKTFQRDLPNKLKPVNMPQASPAKHPWWKKVALLHLFPLDYINFLMDGYDPKNTWIYPLNSGPNPAQGKYFTSITSGIEVSQVSAVKNKYNVSYLAVLAHCFLQGVRQALETEGRSVPDQVMFRFTRPKPHHPEGLTNHVYITGVPLPMAKTSVKSSLQNIEVEMKKEKLTMLPVGLDLLIQFAVLLPAALTHFLYINLLPPGFGCTNLPVSKDVTSYDGVNMTDYMANLGPMSPQRTLMIAAVGDGGRQNIVASVDQSSYSSQAAFEKLGDYIKNEFNSLVESLQDK